MGELTPRDKARRLAIALLVVVCIGGVAVAIASTREVDANGDTVLDSGDPCEVLISGEEVDAPACDPSDEAVGEIVEQLFPAQGDEVLRQQQVGIDLGPRYDGSLVVNGVSIPDDQLLRRPELNQVFFQPGEGTAVTELTPGRNCVIALVWPIAEGPASGQPIEWCFEVT